MEKETNETDPIVQPTPDNRPNPHQPDLVRSVRAIDHCETLQNETLGRQREAHDTFVMRRHRLGDLIEGVEFQRVGNLRGIRLQLETELLAAQQLASEAFAVLGLPYDATKTKAADVYSTAVMPEADAARISGMPGTFRAKLSGTKFLKYAGLAGCALLGTVGTGTLILHMPPKMLFASPVMLVVAAGMACILVGGVSLFVQPTWQRLGSRRGFEPRRNLAVQTATAVGMTGVTVAALALIDCKFIMALNANRALISPESAPSFAVAFLTALALSACYVVGTSALAYDEGIRAETEAKIAAEQHRAGLAYVEDRRRHIEVQQAVEAANYVELVNGWLAKLDAQVTAAETGLRRSLADNFSELPHPPQLSPEQLNELAILKENERHAGRKVAVYDHLKARLNAIATNAAGETNL